MRSPVRLSLEAVARATRVPVIGLDSIPGANVHVGGSFSGFVSVTTSPLCQNLASNDSKKLLLLANWPHERSRRQVCRAGSSNSSSLSLSKPDISNATWRIVRLVW